MPAIGPTLTEPTRHRLVLAPIPFTAFQDIAYGLTGSLAGFLADCAGYGSVFLAGCGAALMGLGIALSLRKMNGSAATR